jgi:hypothetical protein
VFSDGCAFRALIAKTTDNVATLAESCGEPRLTLFETGEDRATSKRFREWTARLVLSHLSTGTTLEGEPPAKGAAR